MLMLVTTKHLYNICTLLGKRRRRCADVIQMLYRCFVFEGTVIGIVYDTGPRLEKQYLVW